MFSSGRSVALLAVLSSMAAPPADAQRSADTLSAPITAIGYHLTIDSADAAEHRIRVGMTFSVTSSAPVLLALPAWTPGAYELG
jgi:hypothetical protein